MNIIYVNDVTHMLFWHCKSLFLLLTAIFSAMTSQEKLYWVEMPKHAGFFSVCMS